MPLSRCGLHAVASAFCRNKGDAVHLLGAKGQPLGVHWPSQLPSGATVGGAVIEGAVTVSMAGSRQEEAMACVGYTVAFILTASHLFLP